MCNYRCPHAERKKCAGFLLCRLLYRDGVNYGIRENAMGAICAHQKPCPVTGLMENTDEARKCAVIPPEAPEAAPAPKTKGSRKKG